MFLQVLKIFPFEISGEKRESVQINGLDKNRDTLLVIIASLPNQTSLDS